MSQSSKESLKESTHLKQQSQPKQTPPPEVIISASEIEKLYLRIKEDWLWIFLVDIKILIIDISSLINKIICQ